MQRILTAIIFLGAVFPVKGATDKLGLALDSARASAFWSLLNESERDRAYRVLDSDSLPQSAHWQGLANLLRAFSTDADSSFAEVPSILDRGVPSELADHANWLRAKALLELGQPHLAGIYIRNLLNSQIKFYQEFAIQTLVSDSTFQESIDSLQTIDNIALRIGASEELRQQIQVQIASLWSRSGKHGEAWQTLWSAYLLSPGSDLGKQARTSLDNFEKRYGFTAPERRWEDVWNEIECLERSGLKAEALDKLAGIRQRGRFSFQDELLIARQVRISVALRRHSDALRLAEQHLKQFPSSKYRDEMLFSMVRSAYLTDQDDLAIQTAEELARTGTDRKHIGESWRLIGLLHIDRDRPNEATEAFDKWFASTSGGEGSDDALWNRGWARMLAGRFEAAARDFEQLTRDYPRSGYSVIGLYWSAQAYQNSGHVDRSDSLCAELHRRYPFSYYAQLGCHTERRPEPLKRDFRPLSLDELVTTGGKHTRAFAMLAALGLWEMALREWPNVEAECGKRADVAWWRPLSYWKNNERFQAWRWTIKEFRDEAASAGERPADFFNLWYPVDYEPLILDFCNRYHVEPYLALGVICQESHFDDQIVSPAGAVGLMQLMPATAREQAKRLGQDLRESDLLDGPRNLEIGIAHLADLLDDLNGDTILTLCAYNAGINAAKRWKSEFGDLPPDMFVERIPYRETRLYVKHILQHIAAYKRLYPHLQSPLQAIEP